MKLREYVDSLVDKFGVHQSYKTVIGFIILAERVEEEALKADKFDTPRDRAAFAMPYQVKIEDIEERERVLNFLELLIIQHRQDKHGEDWNNRIIQILENTVFLDIEKELLADPEGFWGG